MNFILRFLIAVGMSLSTTCLQALAQAALTNSVQSTAGGTATAGSFSIVATTGQPSPVGQATAGQFTLFSGFIHTLDVAAIAVPMPPSSEIGKSVPITWSVAGGTVANVKIELSRDNGATYKTLVATTPNDGNENVTFGPPVSSQAQLRVSDVLSGALPGTSGVFSITAQRFTTISTSITGGTVQTAYRMISFPASLDDPTTKTVLENDLGVYDNKKWRLFDYVNGNFVEYPNARAFDSGRALFLIASTSKQVTTGSGAYGGEAVSTLNLSAGWNMVGNPYNLSVPVSALSLGSSEALSLISYEGSWSGSVSSIEPFKGYALKVNTATTLTIRPNFSGVTAEPLAKTEESPVWAIQIKARCQEARDENNFAGLAAAAKTTWDALDLSEPPAIGEYVAVDFPHEDWAERADRYTTDFRPENSANDGHVWEMAVRSNIPDRVNLAFEPLADGLPEVQIYLVDESAQIAQDLRTNSRYTLLPLAAAKEKRLKLVAGPAKFVEKTVADLAPIPDVFELSQNYPNPFWSEATSRFAGNPETAIRFGLPQTSRVTLKVFDLAGREVATLVANEEFPAGRHQRLWNGRDQQGRQVGSGVYFYRLVAGSFTKTMKLTLLR